MDDYETKTSSINIPENTQDSLVKIMVWDKYFAEVNTGKGIKLPGWLRPYLSYVLPIVLIIVFVVSII